MKAFLGLLALISGAASAADRTDQCFRYDESGSLQGKLTRQTFAEQPNYESIAKGDAQASYFFLSPSMPICVRGRDAKIDRKEMNVKIVQLVFMDGESTFNSLRPYLGKTVRCRGKFFHAISGHRHSRVLFETSKCMPIQHDAVVGRMMRP